MRARSGIWFPMGAVAVLVLAAFFPRFFPDPGRSGELEVTVLPESVIEVSPPNWEQIDDD